MTDAVENQYVEMAYARVSSKNQTLARQEASILNAVPDLKAKYFYKDKWTGKEFDRPEYTRLKEKVEELTEVNPNINLRLTVHELDRLGRDYKEIQKEVYWFRARGVKIRFLDIPEQLISETLGIGKGGFMFNQNGQVLVLNKTRLLRKGETSSVSASKDVFTSDSIDECKSFYTWINSKFTRFFILINISSVTILNDNTFRFVPAPPSGKFDHIYTDINW